MKLTIYCPSCGEVSILLFDIAPGAEFECPVCGTRFRIEFSPLGEDE